MEYKYTGKSPAVLYRGIAFPKGKYVTVPEALVARLEDHPNFRAKPGKKAADSES